MEVESDIELSSKIWLKFFRELGVRAIAAGAHDDLEKHNEHIPESYIANLLYRCQCTYTGEVYKSASRQIAVEGECKYTYIVIGTMRVFKYLCLASRM